MHAGFSPPPMSHASRQRLTSESERTWVGAATTQKATASNGQDQGQDVPIRAAVVGTIRGGWYVHIDADDYR